MTFLFVEETGVTWSTDLRFRGEDRPDPLSRAGAEVHASLKDMIHLAMHLEGDRKSV